MKIKEWIKPNEQMCYLGSNSWGVARLFQLSKGFPVLEIPVDHLCLSYSYENLSLRDMVMHISAIIKSDLNTPIILDEDGDLMDGRHRVMKALLTGKKTIKAVRFDENPTPCQISKD